MVVDNAVRIHLSVHFRALLEINKICIPGQPHKWSEDI